MNFFGRARSSPLSALLLRRRRAASSPIPSPPLPRSPSSSPLPPNSSFPFAAGTGRSYSSSFYSPRPDVQHFRRRGGPRWYQNPRAVVLVVVCGGAATAAVYFGNLETVPYTKRSHLILISPAVERQLGEFEFEKLKSALGPKLLPALHPDSVRVRLLSDQIIRALQRGLHYDERRWSDTEFAAELSVGALQAPGGDKNHDTTLALHVAEEGDNVESSWSREDEILDDKWVDESRKAGKARGSQPATRHLDGLKWEVLVVRDSTVNAFCLPGGKIMVFTGLLENFPTDAEIATVIAHEVAHAMARHTAETITKNLWFGLLQLIALQFIYMPDLINAMSNLLLRLPFSRRMEMEADHIGLLLLASAGYDPRVAPKVYEKLGKITGDSAWDNYLSTHPSSKKRAQLLSQAKVMDEALQIYRESVDGRGSEGFLWS